MDTASSTPQDWETESDLATLERAKQITGSRLARAKALAVKKAANLEELAGVDDADASGMLSKGYRCMK